jgi:NAD+ kinase
VGQSGIPILGVNAGRLGFLASTPFEELDQALEKLVSGNFQIDCRTLVQATTNGNIFGEDNFALKRSERS